MLDDYLLYYLVLMTFITSHLTSSYIGEDKHSLEDIH